MIANILGTASRHFGLPSTKAAPITITETSNITRKPFAMTYATTATNPAPTTAQVDVAFDNPHVQVAAERLAAKRQLLAEIAGIRSSILEAIDAGGTTDPIAIVEELGRLAADADDAIAAVRAETRQHDAQRRERRLSMQPLRMAVSARISALSLEKESLVGLIAAAAASGAPRATSSAGQLRYENLLASGLSNEQIAGLGVGLQNPTDLSNERQARIAEIDRLLVPLWGFAKNPRGDVALLVGLGFDDLIAARLDAEVAANKP